jgi:hypothetical protein
VNVHACRSLPSVELVRQDEPGPSVMAMINRRTLRPLEPADVHVRRAFIINDGVDSFWSQFPPEEIDVVARLMYEQAPPAVIGHRRDMMPVARFFAGERVHRAGKAPTMVEGVGTGTWGAADFYWMRGHSQAEDLALNIDGAIASETSLRWAFEKPICALDGGDIRECDHMPGELYDGKRAYYQMRDTKRLVEGSFVFRGGQLETEMTLRRVDGDRRPDAVVDSYLKEIGVRVGEEERAGLIEFARCYDTRKLEKRKRSEGWFASLPKRTRGLSWFRESAPTK